MTSRRVSVRRWLSAAVVVLVTVVVCVLSLVEAYGLREFLQTSEAVRLRAQAETAVDTAASVPLDQAGATRLASALASADTGAVVLWADGAVRATPAQGTIGRAAGTHMPVDAVTATSGMLKWLFAFRGVVAA